VPGAIVDISQLPWFYPGLGSETAALPMDCIVRNSLRYLVTMVSRDLIDQAGQLLAEAAGAESKVILFWLTCARRGGAG